MQKPSKEEFDLVIEAIRYEYKNKPISLKTPTTLLEMAGSFASEAKREGIFILLDLAKHPELKNISDEHIISIVDYLRLVYKVLDDCSPRTHFPSDKPFTIPVSIRNDPNRFCLKIYDSFDNWYAAYKFRRNRKLEDMSPKTLEHIYDWVTKINEKFEINPEPRITLIEKNLKGDGLDFLENEDIIKSHSLGYRGLDNEYEVNITLNVDEFIRFKGEIEKAYLSKLGKIKAKKDSKNKVAFPPDTKWENITIKFKDGHNVVIKIKEESVLSDYKTMGFEDKRTRKPDMQWELLIRLSKNNGEISWQTSPQQKITKAKSIGQDFGFEQEEDGAQEGKNKGFRYIKAANADKKRKQELAKQLKEYFGINEDPFRPYRQEGSYKIKINLIPD